MLKCIIYSAQNIIIMKTKNSNKRVLNFVDHHHHQVDRSSNHLCVEESKFDEILKYCCTREFQNKNWLNNNYVNNYCFFFQIF